ncbi:MAG: hypothetical protein IPM85_12360 [Chitinophagaceae bacterium]|nr:hypothetical protein [Chitinophagaceae bacterium]
MAKLDSVQQSASPGRYFAGLYINAVNNADNFWNTKTEEQKKLNLRFESRFASLFFAASDSFSLNKQPPPVWEYFFSGEEHSALQYQLLGINAHINGDIYQALTQEFSLQELKAYKANFLAFGKLLAE